MERKSESRLVGAFSRTTCLLMDALRAVRRPRHRQGTMLPLDQGNSDGNGNNDDNLPGEFDGGEPDDLLINVQASKSSVPATYATSRISPNPRVELQREAASVARSTGQVGHLSSF